MLELSLGNTGGPLEVLCLGAHSDDIEIGCGGLVLSLLKRRRPVHVHWVVFSGAGEREREARRAASLFLKGAASSDVTIHQYRDGFFPHEPAIKEAFERLKRQARPDLVLTHFREDR